MDGLLTGFLELAVSLLQLLECSILPLQLLILNTAGMVRLFGLQGHVSTSRDISINIDKLFIMLHTT